MDKAVSIQEYVLSTILNDSSARAEDVVDSVNPSFFDKTPLLKAIYLDWLHHGSYRIAEAMHERGPEYVLEYTRLLSLTLDLYSYRKDYIHKEISRYNTERLLDKIETDLVSRRSEIASNPESFSNWLRVTAEQLTLQKEWHSYTLMDIYKEVRRNSVQRSLAPSPYVSLLSYVPDIYAGDYWIVGARPSVGKTAFGFNFLYRLASIDVPVYFLSLEMHRRSLLERAVALCKKCTISEARRYIAGEKMYFINSDTIEKYLDRPLYVSDVPSVDQNTLRLAYLDAERRGCKVMCIDYLQLVRYNGRRDRRDLEIGEISSRIKEYTRQYDMCSIVLSQLNRSSEQRANRRPMLADLRDSGSLEQDADVVFLLHRDKTESDTEMLLVDVAKNRQGPIGSVSMTFHLFSQTIEDAQ